ncbi:MAG: translocation/assembly module TamB domain-containing protein [Alphaproteobacteria bacterium]
MTHTPSDPSPSDQPGRGAQRPAIRRRGMGWPAWFRLGLLGLVGFVVVVFLVASLGLGGEGARRVLLNTGLSFVNTPGKLEISVGRTFGAWPWRIGLEDVTVADGQGVYASLDRLDLRLDPAALLTGQLTVKWLRVHRPALRRLPEVPTAEPAPPKPLEVPSIPTLPIAVVVEDLSITDLRLGEAVMGRAAAFDLTGAASMTQDGAMVTLDLRQTDSQGVHLAAKLERNVARDRFRMRLRAGDRDGGLVSHLAGIPDLGPVRIAFRGQGTGDDWSGGGQVRGGAFGDLGLSFDGGWASGHVLDLQAVVVPGDTVPADARRILGREIALGGSIDIAHSLDGAPGLSVDAFYAGLGRLAVTGRFGLASDARVPGGGHLDGSLSVALGDLVALLGEEAPFAVENGTVDVTVAGPVASPSLGLAVDADGPSAAGAHADLLSLSFDLHPEGALYSLEGQGALTGFDPGTAENDWPLGRDLALALAAEIDPAAEAVRLEMFRAALDGALLTGEASGSWASMEGTGRLRLTVSALERLVPDLIAGAGFETTVTARLAGETASVDLESRLSALKASNPAFGKLIGPSARLDGQASVDLATSAVSLKSLSLRTGSGHLAMDATGALRPAAGQDPALVKGHADLALSGLTFLGELIGQPLTGSLALDADVTGPLDGPAVDAAVRAPRIALSDLILTDLALTAAARPDGDGWRADTRLAVNSETPSGTMTHGLTLGALLDGAGGVTITTADGELAAIAPRIARSGDAIALSTQSLAPLGTLIKAALGPETPLPAGGSFNALLRLSAEPSLEFEAENLAVVQPGGPPLSIRSARLSAAQQAFDDLPGVSATLTLQTLERASLRLENITLKAEGPLSGLAISASLKEPGSDGLKVDLGAALSLAKEEEGIPLGVTLASLEARRSDMALRLSDPVQINLSEDGLGLPETRFALSKGDRAGALILKARQGNKAVSADLVMEDVPAGISGLVPGLEPFEGRLDGTLSLTSSPKTGKAELRVTGRGLRTARVEAVRSRKNRKRNKSQAVATGDGDESGADLNWRADWDGRTLETTFDLGTGPEQRIDVTATLPLGLSAEGLPEPPADPQIGGRIEAVGRLEKLLPLLPTDEHRIAGLARADLTLGGSVSTPTISGLLGLEDGRYENLSTGTVLENMVLDFETGTGALTFMATDPDEGRLSTDGTVKLAGPDGVTADLDVTLRKMRLTATDDVLAVASGAIDVTGDLTKGFDVAGTVTLDDVDVTIPDQVPPNVVDLEVVEVHGVEDLTRAKQPDTAPQPPLPVRLAIDVRAKDTITVVGKGLDSRWGGDLTLRSAADGSSRLGGQIRLRRGKLELLGRNFDLEQGLVSFDGGLEVDPRLRIIARNEGPDVTAIVTITGPASKPEIALSSEPPLPQDAILAQVLFGKNPSELTTFELLQLGEAVASLSGGGGGPDPIGAAKSALGIDVLKFGLEDGASGETGVSVTVGKYVTDDIYVGVKQGSLPGSSAVTVELEITRNLIIHTDVSQASESVVGLRWRWDY